MASYMATIEKDCLSPETDMGPNLVTPQKIFPQNLTHCYIDFQLLKSAAVSKSRVYVAESE